LENWTYYSAYDGEFTLSLTLDAAGLLDLGNDGLLDFSLSALAGNYYFRSASLTADISERSGDDPNPVDPNPIDPNLPVGVPEPSTPAMFFAALVAFAIQRRARSASN
jgi:hypothetical protein